MDKIRELPTSRTSALFDERERVALELGERMTTPGQAVDDELVVRLRRHFSEDEIVGLNIPTGIPLVYELDADLRPISHRYLGDPEEARRAAEAVARQAQAKP